MSEKLGSDDLLADARRALLEAEQAADSGAASGAARELCAAFRALDDTMSADGELPAAWSSKFWTVIGVWRDDEPIPLGVINGRHMLDGQDEECPDDVWAELAEADGASSAETAAVAKMRYSDS
jgi:hypothetical protein